MRYLVLACDYDGTLAHDGRVDEATVAALEACLRTGRKLLLVTGRELEDLSRVFTRLDLFEWVVAENGAVLYSPATRETVLLGDRPPDPFLEALRKRRVEPCSVGRVIVATWEPHEGTVLQTIRDFGLELQVIFNKGAVMVLPSGVNKATGLVAALQRMSLSPHNVLAVGDAENDHAMLATCEASAAVANAVPWLKERADLVTEKDHGAGVCELIQKLVTDGLSELEPRLVRHHILLGYREDGTEVRIPPYGLTLLVAGTSGAGKSSISGAFLERLAEQEYQYCVIDPEGDYHDFEGPVPFGTTQQAPDVDAVLRLLEHPKQDAVVNLVGIRIEDRPNYFLKMLARLQELRARTGRPHWILVDEAHHVLPAAWETRTFATPPPLDQTVLVTLEPNRVVASALKKVDVVIAAGEAPEETLRIFSETVGIAAPALPPTTLPRGEMIVWRCTEGTAPLRVAAVPRQSEVRRHSRKYAEGEIEPERSFYFRGPEGKLELRAQNLILFMQIGDGVDDETWMYHLRQGDYSRWFREGIKDRRLADETAKLESDPRISASASRQRVRQLIEEDYTLPAKASAVS